VPSRPEFTREQILAFRRRAGGLEERMPAAPGAEAATLPLPGLDRAIDVVWSA
jgi:hypothetical protein